MKERRVIEWEKEREKRKKQGGEVERREGGKGDLEKWKS